MALSAFSLIPLSKPTSIPLLSFRRLIPIHAAARELREGVATEKRDSDNPAGLHRAITLKSLEERQPERVRIAENGFRMALGDLLKQSRVLPLRIFGDLAVEITGIENDSRKVSPGDLFVCCIGYKTDGHLFINDAITRGAVVVIASRNIELDGILGCGALVIVEEVNSLLPHLAANFYGNPSERMTVIGVTGTNGKTTTAHLVRGIYVAMGVKTGMLGTVGYHAHEEIQLEVPNTTPDAVTVQKLMAKMVRNGTETVVMEASSHGLALGRCDAIDFDVAVFTNLTRDHYDFHVTEEDYRNSKAKLFSGMVDPNCHCKVVNIDDPNAYFFAAQGNENVPVVTYAMENGDADVFPLDVELSLLKTAVSVKTPKGNLQISTCLIGRHNVYNILAAVAVGIGISAMLEEIKEGIERVEAVSGRFELINENQPFGVIVDFAHTPDALSRLLDAVRELGARRIITVFGCAGESDKGKRSMMTKVATDRSEIIILTSDNPKSENLFDILNDMLSALGWTVQDYIRCCGEDFFLSLPNGHKLFVHDSRRLAVWAAITMAEEDDVVVVAGRGHETYQLLGNKRTYIDDKEECREALRYLKKLHLADQGEHKCMMAVQESMMSFFRRATVFQTPNASDKNNSNLMQHA